MLTRIIWQWERNRPHPCYAVHNKLETVIQVGPLATLAILAVPSTVADAVWSLWSWLKFMNGRVKPIIFVDGEIPKSIKEDVLFRFPGLEIFELLPWLEASPRSRSLARFSIDYRLGKKLALIVALQEHGPLLYSDSDIIVFNRPDQLIECMELSRPAYMQEAGPGSYDADIIKCAENLGLMQVWNLNSGLLFVPKGVLDHDLLELVLQQPHAWQNLGKSWFTEQTLVAILVHPIGAMALEKKKYVVSTRRQFYHEKDEDYGDIAIRHFTGPVRHVMYRRGIPFLYQREQKRAR